MFFACSVKDATLLTSSCCCSLPLSIETTTDSSLSMKLSRTLNVESKSSVTTIVDSSTRSSFSPISEMRPLTSVILLSSF